jgi:hypothetical protein
LAVLAAVIAMPSDAPLSASVTLSAWPAGEACGFMRARSASWD